MGLTTSNAGRESQLVGKGDILTDPAPDQASFINGMVKGNPVVVFSKTYCPACKRAKSILDGLGLHSKVVELDTVDGGGIIQDVLERMTSARTVSHSPVPGLRQLLLC